MENSKDCRKCLHTEMGKNCMKKFLIFLVFPLTTAAGQIQPVVDINGKLQYPSTSTFKIANDIASDSTT